MKREAAIAGAYVLALWAFAIGALALSKHLERPHVNTAQFIRRSQLDLGTAALNQQANRAVKQALRQHGLRLVKTTIEAEKVDGPDGTVAARVVFVDRDGKTVQTDLTLIFHRSAWQLGQVTEGVPQGWSN